MNWKNITLAKFQRIDAWNSMPYDEIERMLHVVTEVYGMTEQQLDATRPRRVEKMIRKTAAIFSAPMPELRPERIGPYIIIYDISQATLGQYIEVEYFRFGQLWDAHRLLSSMSHYDNEPYRADGHPNRSEFFLHCPAAEVIGARAGILEAFERFNREYRSLFGLSEGTASEGAKGDPFNRKYGWIYSASQVAEYERITLNDAYGLPVRQAFNDLAYLKERGAYEVRERDRLMREYKLKSNV